MNGAAKKKSGRALSIPCMAFSAEVLPTLTVGRHRMLLTEDHFPTSNAATVPVGFLEKESCAPPPHVGFGSQAVKPREAQEDFFMSERLMKLKARFYAKSSSNAA